MKAVKIEKPWEIACVEQNRPEKPGKGQALIRIMVPISARSAEPTSWFPIPESSVTNSPELLKPLTKKTIRRDSRSVTRSSSILMYIAVTVIPAASEEPTAA